MLARYLCVLFTLEPLMTKKKWDRGGEIEVGEIEVGEIEVGEIRPGGIGGGAGHISRHAAHCFGWL